MNETRVDVKVGKEFEELNTFLTFHQFPFKLGEEKTFDVEKLAEVKDQFLLIENDKIEEFKVLYCIFKDLKANSGVIEDKPVTEKRPMGDDTALRLVKEELLLAGIEDLEAKQEEESPFQFRKEEEKENQDKPLEEAFYDKKGKKKKKEKKQKTAKKERSTGFKVFLLLIWIIIVVILALMFVLIR
ncbi:hypothetical protein [endosymbiont 'TC1' of Trimyema compressum]|uniref:hypothetical protein n=1 Tax=endosymbiont 'TC1' of Trimyema compressum TaxID=243899 RepID=UPI001392218B|nr:hypothetical protein [endosymbiont 'TC1' of Trimyema compressum]